MRIITGYILTYLYIISVLIIVSIFKNKNMIKEETSRKLIHILVGLSWFIMVYFFKISFHLIIPPLTFVFINYLSYKKGIISAMERTSNNSKGTIYFAISFVILSIITYKYPSFLPFYGIGILTMTLGDGIAPFIGQKWDKYKIGKTNKTYSGSFTILVIAILIANAFSIYYHLDYNILHVLIIGITSCILELIGKKGTDNLTLPIGIAIIAYLLTL